MDPITIVKSKVAPLDRADVDTDQIIPKQFLKRVERTGFGEFLFFDWKNEDFYILDRPEYEGARILVAGRNFGCGSSREHAPWAIQDFGFDVVIAPSFADIFRTNCTKIGMLPITLSDDDVRDLTQQVLDNPGAEATVDLEECVVAVPRRAHRGVPHRGQRARPPAERLGRHRPHHAEGLRDRRIRGESRAAGPGHDGPALGHTHHRRGNANARGQGRTAAG